jgi:hypothetical protein
MTLLNAPAYNENREKLHRNILVGVGIAFALFVVLFFAGYMSGNGWLFTNIPAEHKVNNFFNALQAKDYAKAYGIYNNDPNWQQHPQKYSGYTLKDFTHDWTTDPRNFYPITSHHVDTSRTDGSGFWGTGIIVAVRVNMQDGIPPAAAGEPLSKLPGHKLFMYVNRADGTLTWPAPHELLYN